MGGVQADIILAINEEYGTDYDQEAPWHSLFAEDPSQVRYMSHLALQPPNCILPPPSPPPPPPSPRSRPLSQLVPAIHLFQR